MRAELGRRPTPTELCMLTICLTRCEQRKAVGSGFAGQREISMRARSAATSGSGRGSGWSRRRALTSGTRWWCCGCSWIATPCRTSSRSTRWPLRVANSSSRIPPSALTSPKSLPIKAPGASPGPSGLHRHPTHPYWKTTPLHRLLAQMAALAVGGRPSRPEVVYPPGRQVRGGFRAAARAPRGVPIAHG